MIYKSLQVIVEVARLGMSVEQVQIILSLNLYLSIEDSFVREGIALHSIRVRIELRFDYRESRYDQ